MGDIKSWLLDLLPLCGGFLGCLFWIALKQYKFAFIKHVGCIFGIYWVFLISKTENYSPARLLLLLVLLILEYALFSYLLWLAYRFRSRKDRMPS